jgi:hypothetical protein
MTECRSSAEKSAAEAGDLEVKVKQIAPVTPRCSPATKLTRPRAGVPPSPAAACPRLSTANARRRSNPPRHGRRTGCYRRQTPQRRGREDGVVTEQEHGQHEKMNFLSRPGARGSRSMHGRRHVRIINVMHASTFHEPAFGFLTDGESTSRNSTSCSMRLVWALQF